MRLFIGFFVTYWPIKIAVQLCLRLNILIITAERANFTYIIKNKRRLCYTVSILDLTLSPEFLFGLLDRQNVNYYKWTSIFVSIMGKGFFNNAWLHNENYSHWLSTSKSNRRAMCRWCKKEFDVGNMGEHAVKSHATSKKPVHLQKLSLIVRELIWTVLNLLLATLRPPHSHLQLHHHLMWENKLLWAMLCLAMLFTLQKSITA